MIVLIRTVQPNNVVGGQETFTGVTDIKSLDEASVARNRARVFIGKNFSDVDLNIYSLEVLPENQA